MTTPIKPMSAEEILKSLEDSQFKTAVVYATSFIPDEDWLRYALASHLAYVKEKLEENEFAKDTAYYTEAYNAGVQASHAVLQSEIDELTK